MRVPAIKYFSYLVRHSYGSVLLSSEIQQFLIIPSFFLITFLYSDIGTETPIRTPLDGVSSELGLLQQRADRPINFFPHHMDFELRQRKYLLREIKNYEGHIESRSTDAVTATSTQEEVAEVAMAIDPA